METTDESLLAVRRNIERVGWPLEETVERIGWQLEETFEKFG